MRNDFLEELVEIAEIDSRIFLIVGDLGFGVIEDFQRKFPKRFLNAGVAEQNMMGLAAGLASAGYKPFVYSIANFPTFRCLEQIRNDVCYQELDVSIVAVGAGLSYGTLGYSHHAVEDIAIIRALPGMYIFSPADARETRIALRYSIEIRGPKYFRIGKNGETPIFDSTSTSFPKETELLCGSDLLIMSTGAIVSEALLASRNLAELGITASVIHFPILKPLSLPIEKISKFDNILVLEEHSIVGGFSSIVLEQLALAGLSRRVKCLAIQDRVVHTIGNQDFLRQQYGIDHVGIVATAKDLMRANRP